MREMFYAVKPEKGRNSDRGIDVSSYGPPPYNRFSPFTYSADFKIPVPGQDDVYASSVESIWQGLKVIDGKTDFKRFQRNPKKRYGSVEGHLFGKEIIDEIEARNRIFKPSYFFYLNNLVPSQIKDDVLKKGLEDSVYFYDVDSNLDIDDRSGSLAHSVFLKQFFDEYLQKKVLEEKTKIDREYKKKEFKHETLAEPLVRALGLFGESSHLDKALMIRFLENPGRCDGFTARYYSELLREIKKEQLPSGEAF